jgi:hypothetical protein
MGLAEELEQDKSSMQKNFKLSTEQIQPLTEGHGGCIATDMITVEGRRVHFMYREPPHNDLDSGWRFTAGLESEEYMDDPDNHEVHDVNTIANYDRDIVEFLNAPIGSAFERDRTNSKFLAVDFEAPPD